MTSLKDVSQLDCRQTKGAQEQSQPTETLEGGKVGVLDRQ